jgi:uncharacterized protein YbbC (DUF1343 family)
MQDHGWFRLGKGWLLLLGVSACAPRAGVRPAATPTPTFAAAPRVSLPLVRPGIEVLLEDSLALVRGRRVGLVTNLAAVDRNGVGDIERLRQAGVNLVALFGPEHGLAATAAPGQKVASAVDSVTRIPIYSLYGANVRPTPAMLADIDVLLVDLPDVGARYFTYLATTVEVMLAAAPLGIPVVVLDRPNPIGGAMQGTILDTAFTSMVGRLAVPMRHGLTLGEQARLAARDLGIAVDLRVVPADGWRRSIAFEGTGLPFRAPSPNLKDVDALFHYTGTCLFEGTALSVGRGTDLPFHMIGAPWLDTTTVLRRLRQARLPGVAFEGTRFTPINPGDGKFPNVSVVGIRLRIVDRATYDPTRTAVHLLATLQAVHPTEVKIGGSFDRLAGGKGLREALLRGDDPDDIVARWRPGLAAFRDRVAGLLLYPR